MPLHWGYRPVRDRRAAEFKPKNDWALLTRKGELCRRNLPTPVVRPTIPAGVTVFECSMAIAGYRQDHNKCSVRSRCFDCSHDIPRVAGGFCYCWKQNC